MPRRRASNVSSDDYVGCFGAICSFIGCLLCLGKMKPSSRILLTWFWLLIISVIAGFIVSSRIFSSTSFKLHPSDMRAVSGISTGWCNGVEINSDFPVDTYLLPSTPELMTGASDKKVYTFTSRDRLLANEYKNWDLYLLRGSSILVDSCREIQYAFHEAIFIVIQGEDNYTKWKKTRSCTNCITKQTKVSCELWLTTRSSQIKFAINNDDQYYFVLYNGKSHTSINVNLHFRITRAVYALPADDSTCHSQLTCLVPYDSDSDESIVVNFDPTKTSLVTDVSTIKAKCQPRYSLFVPVFVVTPLTIGLAITALIVFKARQRLVGRQRNVDTVFTISRSGRDQALEGIDHPAFVMEPPPYDECCDAPPTYEEVIRLKTEQTEA